jgi:hypothetical protein
LTSALQSLTLAQIEALAGALNLDPWHLFMQVVESLAEPLAA